jgi:hypothetical protein
VCRPECADIAAAVDGTLPARVRGRWHAAGVEPTTLQRARDGDERAFRELTDPAGRVATPAGLFVLTMAGDRIQAVTRFHLDTLYPRFGLPGSLPAPGGPAR